MIVKPAPEILVVNPSTGLPINPDGEDVPENKYWLRRIADSSVSVITKKPKSTANKEA